MSPTATIDEVWVGRDTSPAEIAEALQGLLADMYRDNESYVPARVLNMICVVDKDWSGEIANRLRGVGRYHASRTIVCSVQEGRTQLDATATIAAPAEIKEGALGLLRETIVVECGPQHLDQLDRIVDPLVVTDLPTCVWSPHGHPEAVDSLLENAQVVLTDSVDEPDIAEAIRRDLALSEKAYIVDLAWLRSTPWRERLATTFDPPRLRRELPLLSEITIRHAPDSGAAALLLAGWFGSRLNWDCSPLEHVPGAIEGTVRSGDHDVRIRLEQAPELMVRGLAGFELKTLSGRQFELARGDGGLRGRYRSSRGADRQWTILGASRGEAGILGEGIRQALLRDPTYSGALVCAEALLPNGN